MTDNVDEFCGDLPRGGSAVRRTAEAEPVPASARLHRPQPGYALASNRTRAGSCGILRNTAFSFHGVAGRSRALRVACGHSPVENVKDAFPTGSPVDSSCEKPTMKTQCFTTRPSCCRCSLPVSRPHLCLTGPSVRPGVPHRWYFCSLLCLQSWCCDQRAHHLREQAIERAQAGDALTPGGLHPV